MLGSGGPVSWGPSQQRVSLTANDWAQSDAPAVTPASSALTDVALNGNNTPRRFQAPLQSTRGRQDHSAPAFQSIPLDDTPPLSQPTNPAQPRRFRPAPEPQVSNALVKDAPPVQLSPPANSYGQASQSIHSTTVANPAYVAANAAGYGAPYAIQPRNQTGNPASALTVVHSGAGQVSLGRYYPSSPPRTAYIDEDTRLFSNPVQEARAPLNRPGSIRSDYPVAPPPPQPVPRPGSGYGRQWSRNYGKSGTNCCCRIFCCALTILLAVGLGVGVYVGVRLLRLRNQPKGIDPNRQVNSNPIGGGPAVCDSKGIISQIASASSTRDVQMPYTPQTSTTTLHIKFKPHIDPVLHQAVISAHSQVGPNLHLDHLTPGQISSFLSDKLHGGWMNPEYNSWLTDMVQRVGPEELDVVKHIKRFYYGPYANVLIVEFEGIAPLQFQGLLNLLAGQKDMIEFVHADTQFKRMDTLTKIDDPQAREQWGLQSVGVLPQDNLNGLTNAWAITTGSRKVIVAVMDTGVDLAHLDLAPNLWVNPGEANGTAGQDDDNNGKVDDIHGWNFVDENNEITDPEGHGTHVAGIIGAVANNGQYGAGVSPLVSIMVLKVLNTMGDGWTSALYRAMEYALEKRAHITSHSLGTTGDDPTLLEAVKKADEVGQLLVAAAGNDRSDNDAAPTYPASYDLSNVISVGWMDRFGCIASSANYGKTSVHLMAPGSQILSTFPTYMASPSGTEGMATMSGSSQATPHVAGAAALILASWEQQGKDSEGQARTVKQMLLDSVDKDPLFENYTITGGKLNVARALAMASNVTLPLPSASAAYITSGSSSTLLWLATMLTVWTYHALLRLF